MFNKIYFKLFIIITILFNFRLAYSVEGIISGSLGETYDDNIYSSDRKEYDFITDIVLILGIQNQSSTSNLRLLGQSTQQIYYKTSELNNNSQAAELSISKEFTSVDRFSISDRFVHYPEPRDFQEQFGMADGRTGYYINILTLRYARDLLSYFSINTYYSNTYTKILSNKNGLNDSISHSGSINTKYEINPFNIISAFYKFTIFETLNKNEQENYKTKQHNIGVGYELFFTQKSSLNIQGGVDYITAEDSNKKNIFGTITLRNQIDERNSLNISASRRYELIPLTNQVYDIWNFSIDFSRELSNFIFITSSVFYQYGDTVSDTTSINSQLIGAKLNLSYRFFAEYLAINIEYIYTKNKRKQTVPINMQSEYDRNLLRLSINASF